MAKLKEIELIADYLHAIQNIENIEKIEIINIPEDVDADIGLIIKLKNKNKWNVVLDRLNDIAWDLFEKKRSIVSCI